MAERVSMVPQEFGARLPTRMADGDLSTNAKARGRKSASRDDAARCLAEIRILENEIVDLEKEAQEEDTRSGQGPELMREQQSDLHQSEALRRELQGLDEDTL